MCCFLLSTDKMEAQIQRMNSKILSKSKAPLSTAIKANGYLFISGQIGYDKSGNLVNGIEKETSQILDNLGIILQENGLTFKDLVSITIYLKDMNNFDIVNGIYRKYFESEFPTRTCIGVADLPAKANVEITATALVK